MGRRRPAYRMRPLGAICLLLLSACNLQIRKAEPTPTPVPSTTPVPSATPTPTATPSTISLEVPIEILQQVKETTNSTVVFDNDLVTLDTSYYDGTVSYFFEILAKSGNATAVAVDLLDASNAVAATIPVPGNVAEFTRYRVSMTPTSANGTYKIRLNATSNGTSHLVMSSARLIVRQTGATKTRVYIPLSVGANDSIWYVNHNLLLSNTTYVSNPDKLSIWKKDTSSLVTLAAGNPWTFEAVLKSDLAGVFASAALYRTDGTAVTGVEVSSQATAPELKSVAFSNSAANFTEGSEFEVRIKTSNGGQNARFYKAGLWVELTDVTKAESYYRCSNEAYASGPLNVTGYLQFMDLSRFSNPSVRMTATMYDSGGGSPTITLQNAGTADAVSGGSTVTGSTLTFSNVKQRKETGALTLTAGNRYYIRINPSSGNGYTQGCNLIVRSQR